MANCGCKPCSKELPDAKRKCKEFSLCVGNKSLHYDGNCLYVTDRKFKIPNGTYTSITFQEGCIVGVGTAPLPVYTPQACCDEETTTVVERTPELKVSPETGNLAVIENNTLTVNPFWKDTTSIHVGGDGSTSKPWQAKVKLNPTSNRITTTEQGLKVELEFADSDTVTVTGDGTTENPYKFNSKLEKLTLPKINSKAVEGIGYSVSEQGLMKVSEGVNFTTNLSFSSSAFTIVKTGFETKVFVDEGLLRLREESYEDVVNNILKDKKLLAKLKAALGL